MSHTIYAAKFEQTIIHQHVHLRRERQSHAPAHMLMRLYPIDKSLVFNIYKAKEGRYVRMTNSFTFTQTQISILYGNATGSPRIFPHDDEYMRYSN